MKHPPAADYTDHKKQSLSECYPVEIERALLSIAGVQEVFVGGEAHPVAGQQIVAWVQMKPGHILDETAIKNPHSNTPIPAKNENRHTNKISLNLPI